MQSLILLRIVKLLIVFAAISPVAFAQDLAEAFSKAEKGEISISELTDEVIGQSIKSPSVGPTINRYKQMLPSFVESAAPIILSKIQSLINDGKFEEAWAVKSLADNIIPSAWPEGVRVGQIFDALSKIEEIKQKQDIRSLALLNLSNLAKEDAEALDKAMRLVAEDFLKKALDEADSFLTIRKIAELSVSFPDLPLNFEAKQIFAKLAQQKNKDNWNFDIPVVQQFVLDNFSENKSSLIELYRWKIISSLEKKNPNRAAIYYNLIVPELNEEDKTYLRNEIMKAGIKSGLTQFVVERIDELKSAGQLNTLNKLVLIFRGYYGWIPLGLPLLLVFPLFKVFTKKKNIQKKYRPTVADDEYTQLLRRLKLEEDASEAQIKKAFRQLVKEHHPDAHGTTGVVFDQDGKVDQKFEELRKTYDRIMEIRKSWFGANR